MPQSARTEPESSTGDSALRDNSNMLKPFLLLSCYCMHMTLAIRLRQKLARRKPAASKNNPAAATESTSTRSLRQIPDQKSSPTIHSADQYGTKLGEAGMMSSPPM